MLLDAKHVHLGLNWVIQGAKHDASAVNLVLLGSKHVKLGCYHEQNGLNWVQNEN